MLDFLPITLPELKPLLSRLSVERSSDDWNGIPQRSPSVASYFSSSSSSETTDDPASISITRREGNGNELDRGTKGTMNDELYDRLQQYVEEAEISIREAFEESTKRRKAERETIEAKLREIMLDPVVAADGFTYEAEAMRGWLDSGRDTSPMTNLQLTHTNLVSNHALRSAIQEWPQQP